MQHATLLSCFPLAEPFVSTLPDNTIALLPLSDNASGTDALCRLVCLSVCLQWHMLIQQLRVPDRWKKKNIYLKRHKASWLARGGIALIKELIIQNKPSVRLYSFSLSLSAVNWQFSVVDICEIKEACCYKEKPLFSLRVKPGVHWLMNGLTDVEINGYRVHKDIGLLSCGVRRVSNSAYWTAGYNLFPWTSYLIVWYPLM